MSNSNNVLIFGATGAVGSAAALSASSHGAKVWLAMRDTSKPIPSLPSTAQSSNFQRLQADLLDPSSVTAAVKQSNAKAAFVYMIHSSSDSMLASFTALKEAGVEFVVFLSSYSVQGAPEDKENHKDHIPRLHAAAEIALKSTGLRYAALRPAWFNSNIAGFWGSDVATGKVRVLYPETRLDWIAPSDIGRVAGVLVAKPPAESRIVYICGPEMLSQRQAVDAIGKALGRKMEAVEVTEEQWFEKLAGWPREMLETIAKGFREGGTGIGGYPSETYEEGVRSVERITGRKSKGLEEWAKENRDMIEGLGEA